MEKESKSLRSLHLHTINSLCADLISARPVGVGKDDEPFQLASDAARSVLNWYYEHKTKWAGNVQSTDVEAIVDCIANPLKVIPETAFSSPQEKKCYALVSIRAHQFGGLHRGGNSQATPEDFTFGFGPSVTMFEGFNGSGKTSILNAIIWTLTGEVLRPQRPPEAANKEFTCEIDGTSQHTLSPVMPLAEDVNRLSDADLLQDATDDGLNPKDIALNMRATVLSLVAETKRKHLLQTREKMQESAKFARSGLPRPSMDTIKSKLQELFSRRPELAVAFRQGTKQSDSDWQSLWDDLIEIGEIKKEDLGN